MIAQVIITNAMPEIGINGIAITNANTINMTVNERPLVPLFINVEKKNWKLISYRTYNQKIIKTSPKLLPVKPKAKE